MQRAGDDESVEDVVERLDDHVARRLLADAAEWHEDVMRAVRLAAAGESDRMEVLKAAVDDGLRTRRHLDYRGSSAWARDAAPVVDALAGEVAAGSSGELVVLLQRAAGHLVKVIMRADDSYGTIGELCRDVLDLHRQACAAGVADPQKLAKWMVRFAFEDQDFFEIDPVAYADALGEKGLPVYRREVAKRSNPAALRWARRGIAETSGWQVAKLYDLAVDLLADADDRSEVVELRRHHHEHMPSASTYAKLQSAANTIDSWHGEVARARGRSARVMRAPQLGEPVP